MRSEGRMTRQRVETSSGRTGAPLGRGRSDDHPGRSSSPILTLRVVEEGSGIPPSCRFRGANPVRSPARFACVRESPGLGRRIAALFQAYRPQLAAIALIILVTSAASIVSALLVRQVFDKALF